MQCSSHACICSCAGSALLTAGYCLYSSSTIFVLTTGKGVYGFTLDPLVGEFILSHDNVKVWSSGHMTPCHMRMSKYGLLQHGMSYSLSQHGAADTKVWSQQDESPYVDGHIFFLSMSLAPWTSADRSGLLMLQHQNAVCLTLCLFLARHNGCKQCMTMMTQTQARSTPKQLPPAFSH